MAAVQLEELGYSGLAGGSQRTRRKTYIPGQCHGERSPPDAVLTPRQGPGGSLLSSLVISRGISVEGDTELQYDCLLNGRAILASRAMAVAVREHGPASHQDFLSD